MNNQYFNLKSSGKNHGFTLIDLLITVVIVTILASIAIPSYQQHVIKSNRATAEAFMLQLANKEEQYLLDARNYTSTIGTGGLNLTPASNVSQKYTITIGNVTNTTYTITAAPTSAQNDTKCGTLTLDQSGTKTPTTDCW